MIAILAYVLALARNLILYGKFTVWVALPRDGYWLDDARVWYNRGFLPFNGAHGAPLELTPSQTLWRWRRP